ncbi:MAG: ECF-type sigma factor [Planctomycetota bacterium]|jgi:RNA polymerase sigma factor (TIGR02999 family)
MSDSPTPDRPDSEVIEDLLAKLNAGEPGAADRLAEALYPELRRMAQGLMRGNDSLLQPTALLNEAWIKLLPEGGRSFNDKSHFLGLACRAMRSVLVDRARARVTQKRGGGAQKFEIQESDRVEESRAEELLTLNDALERLGTQDQAGAQVAEMRLFGGLSCGEIAEGLGESKRTVERRWKAAAAVLKRQLAGSSAEGRLPE